MFTCCNDNKAAYLLQNKKTHWQMDLTSLGVWLSAILCPSNRNLSVLAATPCKNTKKTKHHVREIHRGTRYLNWPGSNKPLPVPVSGCKTPSASSDASSFSPWSEFRCCPVGTHEENNSMVKTNIFRPGFGGENYNGSSFIHMQQVTSSRHSDE